MGHKLYDHSFLNSYELQNKFVFAAKMAKNRKQTVSLKWYLNLNAPPSSSVSTVFRELGFSRQNC